GGALTSNTQMLRDNGIMDKYAEIIKAMEEVVRKGGYGTSVTPVSQFYFQQAFNNVMNGPWQRIAEGYGKMVLGYFGKTPVPPDEEVVKIASEQLGLEPTTQSPRLINDENPKKGIEPAKKVLEENNLPITDENIFITATCGEKGIAFLKGEGKIAVRYNEKQQIKRDTYKITIEGQTFDVSLADRKVVVDGRSFVFSVGETKDSAPKKQISSSETVKEIKSPIVGVITAVSVQNGQSVQAGENLFTIEVMKMETQIKAGENMTVTEVLVAKGTQVAQGQVLARGA
ncbi:MAG: biotin/lipoyl-binding protein, partial [Alphaproteobacteria bacterium]|nr:biotin/lipoyl-binding protein [Alphaproteobacteria bacterium]